MWWTGTGRTWEQNGDTVTMHPWEANKGHTCKRSTRPLPTSASTAPAIHHQRIALKCHGPQRLHLTGKRLEIGLSCKWTKKAKRLRKTVLLQGVCVLQVRKGLLSIHKGQPGQAPHPDNGAQWTKAGLGASLLGTVPPASAPLVIL